MIILISDEAIGTLIAFITETIFTSNVVIYLILGFNYILELLPVLSSEFTLLFYLLYYNSEKALQTSALIV